MSEIFNQPLGRARVSGGQLGSAIFRTRPGCHACEPTAAMAALRRSAQDQVHQRANIDRGGTRETLPLAQLPLAIDSCQRREHHFPS